MAVRRITLILKTNEGGRWVVPHIQEMLRRGHKVSVILPPGEGRLTKLLRDMDVEFHASKFDFRFHPKLSALRGLIALRGQIIATRPDVLHYHLYASALAARICSLGLKVARVHMVAGPLYLESPLIRVVERILMWRDSILIAGSQHTLEQYRQLGLPAARLDCVPYGVNTEAFRPPEQCEQREARMEAAIPSAAFVAIMVAYVYAPKRLVYSHSGIKGHDILLSAWQKFSESKTDVHLMLVGGGFDSSGQAHRLRLMTQHEDEGAHIRWIDSVDDVRHYYWASDISVSPSLSENHGAALEAGACGVARIVSDAGGLPETTSPSSGWVVPRGDADRLRAALEEAYLEFRTGALARKGEASRREMVERFDAAGSAARVVDIIERAVLHPEPPVVSLVSEARLGRSRGGLLAANDAASGPLAWQRYQSRIDGFRLAARVSEVPGSAEILLDSLDVYPLPHYIGLRQFLFNIPGLLKRSWALARTSQVVVVRLPGPLGFLTAHMAMLLRRPLFVEVVGDPETVLSNHSSWMVRWLSVPAKHAMRFCVSAADASRFVTSHTLQRVYPPKPGTPTLAMSNVQLVDDDFSCSYFLPGGGKWRLTAIGSQETNYKGHDLAIEAIAMLLKRGYECELLLVGRGSLHGLLKDQAQALGVLHLITFEDGFNKKDELRKILDNTDIFIHPSRSEGLPRVVIEAMARSRPVIASAVGGISELLPASHLIRPGSAAELARRIMQMVNDPSDASEAAVTNYATAQRYRYDKLELVFDEWCDLISRRAYQLRQKRSGKAVRKTWGN